MITAEVPEDRADKSDGGASRSRAGRPGRLLDRLPRSLPEGEGWRWVRLHPAGVVAGTGFAMMAMTPSLLPRDWLFQGLVSGVSAAVGYGAGVLAAWLVRLWNRWPAVKTWIASHAPDRMAPVAWAVLLLAVPVGLTIMLVVAARWQAQVAALMGIEVRTTGGWLRALPLLLVVAAVIITVARVLREFTQLIDSVLRRWVRLPAPLASVLGVLVAAFIVITILDDVVLQRSLAGADSAFSATNAENFSGVQQPASSMRSGSPQSLAPWDTLGKEGRRFVSGGLPPQAIRTAAAAQGAAPKDPIRVYVGLQSAADPQERADLAVAELDRTGAFNRKVLMVATTTGRGWVNPRAVDSLEAMYGGDTAVVATQYSYLPSWLSFVVDRTRAEEAGRLLFDAISARLKELPESSRPRVFVFGESLGSQGSEHAFSTLADIRAGADGVLWVGPPNSNTLWRSLVVRRDPGTPETRPVYASGLVVRFASRPPDLGEPPTPWEKPRVLYLQHPSDPVVWWSPDLLFGRPDWLMEPRGRDVSPAMSWYPVVTFWQVTADLTNSTNVPSGHGHDYDNMILDAWVGVAAPDHWTGEDTELVRKLLAQYESPRG
jgi:uncharacterized membrane protein